LVADPILTVLRTKLALTASVRIHAFSKRAVQMLFAVSTFTVPNVSAPNVTKAILTVLVANPNVSWMMTVPALWLAVKRTAVTHATALRTPSVP
jgi:hypothetical protein